MALLPVNAEALACEDVGDRGKGIVGLVGRNIMDVRRVGKVRRLVGDVPCHWVGLMSASEALVQGR